MKKRYVFLGVFAVLVIVAATVFLAFSRQGYFMTVGMRGFTQIQKDIFADENLQHSTEQVMPLIQEAQGRLLEFWGEVQSKPKIIISDDKQKLISMGWNGSPALTTSYVFCGAHSYVLISPEGLTVDVIAHELTHAELHARLYHGKMSFFKAVPVWFDEGLAAQTDYRERYSENAWQKLRQSGKEYPPFSELESAEQFYAEDGELRKAYYILSRHEVAQWIAGNGRDGLKDMIERLNRGESFADIY